MTKLGKVANSFNEGIDSRLNNFFTKIACCGNRGRVTEDHTEALLVDGVLRFSRTELLFTGVSAEEVFEFGVNSEAWSDSMNMLSFSSLLFELLLEINSGVNSRFDIG